MFGHLLINHHHRYYHDDEINTEYDDDNDDDCESRKDDYNKLDNSNDDDHHDKDKGDIDVKDDNSGKDDKDEDLDLASQLPGGGQHQHNRTFAALGQNKSCILNIIKKHFTIAGLKLITEQILKYFECEVNVARNVICLVV